MQLSNLLVQLVICGDFVAAFSPLRPSRRTLSPSVSRPRSQLFSSQWDDEDDEKIATENKPRSFDDAGAGLQAEDDQKRMDEMGDFDSNPAYQSADIERFRSAIKERAESLGIQETKVSPEALKEAEERAKAAAANRGGEPLMLDLSQISQTAPRGNNDEEILDIFYEPENEMTEQEMSEADPLGQLSLIEQIKYEFSQTEWPTPFAALKEVVILVASIAVTASFIIFLDSFLRDFYTNIGLIPSPEDIKSGTENMVLPDGWTDGMSEEDFMRLQDEIGDAATSVKDAATAMKSAAFPDL